VDIRQRIEALRKLQFLLDSAFRLPGTNVRFGWDPIVGLVPWAGDLLTGVYSCMILFHANRMRVPRVIQLRMLLNTAVDILLGFIPIAGDVTDVFWKSNARNFALLERHAGGLVRPTLADWLFVAGIMATIAVIALLPLVVVAWLIAAITT
jgi:hypothetical protein